jgi:hypothetical protein
MHLIKTNFILVNLKAISSIIKLFNNKIPITHNKYYLNI